MKKKKENLIKKINHISKTFRDIICNYSNNKIIKLNQSKMKIVMMAQK